MPKSSIGAWRSFSTLAQADILTPQTGTPRRYQYTGDFIDPEANTTYTNADEATGSAAPTQHETINRKLEGSHASKLFPDLAGIAISSVLGLDAVALVSGAAYRHSITPHLAPDNCVLRTMIENDGTDQQQYLGVAFKSVTLKGERGGFVDIECALIGRGGEAADATAKPANSGESYLNYKQVNFTKGGTFDGTTVTGGTSLSARTINFEASFDNKATGDYHFGDASGLYAQIAPNLQEKYGFTLNLKAEMEDATLRNDYLAGTEFGLHIPMIGGIADGAVNYAVHLIYPRVKIGKHVRRREEGKRREEMELIVLEHPTHGAVVVQVVNLHATSYVATS